MTTTGTQVAARFRPIVAVQAATAFARPIARVYLVRPSDSTRSSVDDAVAKEFRTHAEKWFKETQHISSPVDKYIHESYARIIGLGFPAVRHILASLKRGPADWFYALRAITGENPVSDDAAGDMERMTKLWLEWGKRRGLA